MFEKILVPTDFTDEADRVLSYVKGLRVFGLREITLAHVIDIDRAVIFPLPPSVNNTLIRRLEERREDLEREGFIARTLLLEGNPPDEILRALGENDYSLVVTGSHGKRLIEEMLLGSVSETLSRESKVPVLVIRYEVLKDAEMEKPLEQYAAGTFKKVLFPTDFTRLSEEALTVVKKLKEFGVDEVVALHVVDAKRLETELEKTEQMDACYIDCGKVAHELENLGVRVQSVCRVGNPLEEILAVADETSASLIVMGSHGKGVVKEWLAGSVSLDVIRAADRPALVVHERAA